MGVGANAGPGYPLVSPVTGLPGDLNQGVLINDQGFLGRTTPVVGTMQFGPNPYSSVGSISGAPWNSHMYVSIDGGTPQLASNGVFDSGGQWGTIPQSMDPGLISSGGFLPPHTTVKVYFDTDSGLQQMYYVTTGTQTNWTPGNDPEFGYQYTNFNTGLFPFNDAPIYFSYSPSGVGTIYYDV